MRSHLLVLFLCFTVQASPIRAIDGDTFTADLYIWLGLKSRETVRLYGVDTPELRGATRGAGMAAQQFTAAWLAVGDVTLKACSRDAFGRVLAEVTRGESNLGKDLVAAGLAREYRR